MPPKRDVVPGVHRLGSSTVNWYLVEDEGRFTAVDAGMPGRSRQASPPPSQTRWPVVA